MPLCTRLLYSTMSIIDLKMNSIRVLGVGRRRLHDVDLLGFAPAHAHGLPLDVLECRVVVAAALVRREADFEVGATQRNDASTQKSDAQRTQ